MRLRKKKPAIHTLFLDVGGVLLTNGWDRSIRKKAVEAFGLEAGEVDDRHHLIYDTYEEGKLSFDHYLDQVIFFKKRRFSRKKFVDFVLAQSQPHPEMIDLVRKLKAEHGLRVAVVSNEGRVITEHRVRTFRLKEFVDFFIFSCFVHFRKPDPDIFQLALDVAQSEPGETLYIDDRAMLVEAARSLGLHGIHHTGTESTRKELARFGFSG